MNINQCPLWYVKDAFEKGIEYGSHSFECTNPSIAVFVDGEEAQPPFCAGPNPWAKKTPKQIAEEGVSAGKSVEVVYTSAGNYSRRAIVTRYSYE